MKLTERDFAAGVINPTDLIHIVITGDPSQSPQGSSYKVELGKVINDLVPEDIHVTGFTFDATTSAYNLSIEQNGLPPFTQSLGILATDVTVTGGTYNPNTGIVTFYKNFGDPFEVKGFATGYTDFYVTGGSFNQTTKELTLTRNGGLPIPAITGITDTYTNSATTTATIGGIASGSTFDNKSMKYMWDLLLYPYQPPSFNTSFTRTDLATNNDYDLGQSVSAGNQRFTWVTSYPDNVSANTITIQQTYPSPVNLISGSTNDGIEDINLTGATISATTQTLNLPIYKITGIDSKLSAFTSTINVNWKYRWYYGKSASDSLTPELITGLTTTQLITSGKNKQVSFPSTTDAQYMYIILPAALPQYTTLTPGWYDGSSCGGTPISYLSASTISFSNSFGVSTNYVIWRSQYPTGGQFNIYLCP